MSLVPKPRVNLTRFHGVFAPNSKYRARITPAGRGKYKKAQSPDESNQTSAEKRVSITWAKRLKRIFNIDIAYMDVGKGREQDAEASKLAISAVLRSGSLPVSKTRRLYRKYSLT